MSTNYLLIKTELIFMAHMTNNVDLLLTIINIFILI